MSSERWSRSVESMSRDEIAEELRELTDLAGWLDPSMGLEFAELGWQAGDDELRADIAAFEAREEELRARMATLAQLVAAQQAPTAPSPPKPRAPRR